MSYVITIQFNNGAARPKAKKFHDVRGGEVVGMFYTINFTGGSKERFHVNTINHVSEEYVEREAYA